MATFKTRENQRYGFHLTERDVFWTSPVLLGKFEALPRRIHVLSTWDFFCSFVSIVYVYAVLDSISI